MNDHIVTIAVRIKRPCRVDTHFRCVYRRAILNSDVPTLFHEATLRDGASRRLLDVHEESQTLHLPLALNTNQINPSRWQILSREQEETIER